MIILSCSHHLISNSLSCFFTFQAVELDEGLIYVNSRTSGQVLPRQQAFSEDAGMSFTPGQLTYGLPEPGHLLLKWIPSVRNFGGCQVNFCNCCCVEGKQYDAHCHFYRDALQHCDSETLANVFWGKKQLVLWLIFFFSQTKFQRR